MENWDDLRFVIALARYGSMAKAARHLRTNTGTVSRRIKRLNETTNTVLFQKGASEWELTDDGQKLYELAASFSEQLIDFQTTTGREEEHVKPVVVTGVEFFIQEILSKSLGSFIKDNPNIALEINASSKNLSLAFGEADIALRLNCPNEGRLISTHVADFRMDAYKVEGGSEKEWIGLPEELDWTPEMKNGYACFGREPEIRLSSFSSVLEAMKETGLAGILPEFMIAGTSNFERIPTNSKMRTRELWMIIHETRQNDLRIKNTCAWIQNTFAQKLGSA